MNSGVFFSLSRSYFLSARNGFYYLKQAPLIFKPFVFMFAMIYSFILLPIGGVFGLLIVFDWVGRITDNIRNAILDLMDRQSWNVENSFMSFILRPILLIVLSPVFLISLFIPKLSSDVLTNVSIDESTAIISGAGAFKRMNGIIWRSAHRLFIYVSNAPLLVKPIVAVIASSYSLILICIGFIFGLLIPLDWFSRLIESIRKSIVHFVNMQQSKIKFSGLSFMFAPLLLIILSPVFLATILVPKFASHMDIEI